MLFQKKQVFMRTLEMDKIEKPAISNIHVFKTSVRFKKNIKKMEFYFNKMNGIKKWNFDLTDCDNILRIESAENITAEVIELLMEHGFICEELN